MKTEPNSIVTDPYSGQFNTGLTKREYFAAMAMQGISSTLSFETQITNLVAENIASESVRLADALIKELNK